MSWVGVAVGVVSTAGSIYAGNKARKAANKRTPAEQAAEQQALANSRLSSEYGQQALAGSRAPLSAAQQFWQSVLSGNRDSLMSLYGNEINDLGTQSRTAFQTAAQLSPRSGASAEYMSSLPFQRMIAERRITSAARPQAAGELASIGTNLASLGFSGLNGGNAAGSSLLGYGQQRRQYADQAGSDTAGSVYEILKMLGNSGISAYGQYKTNKANNANNTNLLNSGNTAASFWGKM